MKKHRDYRTFKDDFFKRDHQESLETHTSYDYSCFQNIFIALNDDMQLTPLASYIFFLKCPFKAIICPNKVWKLKQGPRQFKIFTSLSRERYYSLTSLVGISSRGLASFGTKKGVSFQTTMDPIYDVRGSPPTYHHQIIFFSDKEVTIAIKNIFYIKSCFNVLLSGKFLWSNG